MTLAPWTSCIRGHRIPKLSYFPENNIHDAIDYIPQDGDVIISSYPKTGTCWLQFIIQQIMTKGDTLPNFMDMYYNIVPFFEMAGLDAIKALPGPRMFKQHFPLDAINLSDNAKYLYICRNPEDVLMSYYHFTIEIIMEELSMDDYLEDFINGEVWYGNYCDHVLSFLKQEHRNNVLLVRYEDLVSNRKEEVLILAKFLGEEHYQCLLEDETIVDRIVQHTEFEYMKKMVAMELPEDPKEDGSEPEDRKVNYFRKGKVGDGKKSLSEAQMRRLKEHVAAKMKGTRLEHKWFSEEKIEF